MPWRFHRWRASRPRRRCWSTSRGSSGSTTSASPTSDDPSQLVSFGTSGHRGSSLRGTFTEAHILAITQAICDYRRGAGHRRPALPGQGHARAVRPGPAHGARGAGGQRRRDRDPARRRRHADAGHLARHPRPQPRPHRAPRRRHRHHAVAQSAGGRRLQVQPAERRPGRHRRDQLDRRTAPTSCCASGNAGVKRMPLAAALAAATTHQEDFVLPYVEDLRNVVDMDAIRAAGLAARRRSAGRRRRATTGSRSTPSTGSTSRS